MCGVPCVLRGLLLVQIANSYFILTKVYCINCEVFCLYCRYSVSTKVQYLRQNTIGYYINRAVYSLYCEV